MRTGGPRPHHTRESNACNPHGRTPHLARGSPACRSLKLSDRTRVCEMSQRFEVGRGVNHHERRTRHPRERSAAQRATCNARGCLVCVGTAEGWWWLPSAVRRHHPQRRAIDRSAERVNRFERRKRLWKNLHVVRARGRRKCASLRSCTGLG